MIFLNHSYKKWTLNLKIRIYAKKGDVLLEFSSVKWDLNEDHTLYCNVLGTLL